MSTVAFIGIFQGFLPSINPEIPRNEHKEGFKVGFTGRRIRVGLYGLLR